MPTGRLAGKFARGPGSTGASWFRSHLPRTDRSSGGASGGGACRNAMRLLQFVKFCPQFVSRVLCPSRQRLARRLPTSSKFFPLLASGWLDGYPLPPHFRGLNFARPYVKQIRVSEVRCDSSVVRRSSHRLTPSPLTDRLDFATLSCPAGTSCVSSPFCDS